MGRDASGPALIDYAGLIPRERLLREAGRRGHIGLALMPAGSAHVNMLYMAGASNKAFDYMAAGMALLVSDLPDWNKMFVQTGFARSCDPRDSRSIATQLRWFLDHPDALAKMRSSNRAQIRSDWNYDCAFAPLL